MPNILGALNGQQKTAFQHLRFEVLGDIAKQVLRTLPRGNVPAPDRAVDRQEEGQRNVGNFCVPHFFDDLKNVKNQDVS